MPENRCAITILCSVMSTSHPNHAVIDAGSKTLGSDPLFTFKDRANFLWQGMPSYGVIKGRSDLWLGAVYVESARVFNIKSQNRLRFVDRLEVISNNPFVVVNMHDKLYGVRNGEVERIILLDG